VRNARAAASSGLIGSASDASATALAALRAEVAAEVAAAIARARQSPEAGPAELGLDEVLV